MANQLNSIYSRVGTSYQLVVFIQNIFFPNSLCVLFRGADGKLEAVNVSGPNGTSVQGSRYSPDKSNAFVVVHLFSYLKLSINDFDYSFSTRGHNE